MRRLTAWVAGAASGIAAYRLLRRRSQAASEPVPAQPAEPDVRAEELRARLDESRAAEPEPEATHAEEPAESETPEDRRRRVHEEGRAALDEMKPE